MSVTGEARRSGWKPWLLAARPKTLPAALVPVWIGSVALLPTAGGEMVRWGLFVATLGSCLAIQIATNLFNDAIDHQRGADTHRRLGPVRVTASGMLSTQQVMAGAVAVCFLAALIAIPLLRERGWPIVIIGSVSLFFAWGYTGGPIPLAYRGLGELFVVLFFGFVAVGGSWYVQTGRPPGVGTWLAGLQTGLYSSALIAINNYRDMAEDRVSGKRTLAVRFGSAFARREIAAFCLGPLLLGLLWWPIGQPLAALWPLAVLPLSLRIIQRVWTTAPGRSFNRFLALAALQLIGFAVFLTLGMWL